MYASKDRLVIFDADGTLIDSFHAVGLAFERHGMDIGDLHRFQRRRKLLKYLGGLREFPKNLRKQLNKESRKQLKQTLTEIYRREAPVPHFQSQDRSPPSFQSAAVPRDIPDPASARRQREFRRWALECWM